MAAKSTPASAARPGGAELIFHPAPNGAVPVWQTGHVQQATAVVTSPDGAWVLTASPRHRGTHWFLWSAADGTCLREFAGTEGLDDGAFSPDGKWLLFRDFRNRKIQIWDIAAGKWHRSIDIDFGYGDQVVFSPHAAVAVILHRSSRHASLRVLDLVGDAPDRTLDLGECISLSPSVLAGCNVLACPVTRPSGKGVILVDLESMTRLDSGADLPLIDEAVHVSPDGTRAVCSAEKGRVLRLFDPRSGKQLAQSRKMRREIRFLGWSTDSARLFLRFDGVVLSVPVSGLGALRLWRLGGLAFVLPGNEAARVLSRDEYLEPAVCTAPHGEVAITGQWSTSLFDRNAGSLLAQVPCERNLADTGSGYPSAAYSHDGSKLVIASRQSAAEIVDAVSGSRLAEMGRRINLRAVTLSKGGHHLVVLGDKSVWVWGVATARMRRHFTSLDGVQCAAFDDDTNTLFMASAYGDITRHGLADGKVLSRWRLPTTQITWLRWSSDGSELLAGGRGNVYSVWKRSMPLRSVDAKTPPVLSARDLVGLSPDGDLFATQSHGHVSICDMQSRSELLKVTETGSRFASFVPGSSRFILSYGSGRFETWDIVDKHRLHEFRADEGLASSAVSSCGRYFAAGGHDGTIRLFDIVAGSALRRIAAHAADVTGLVFLGGDKHIASVSRDRTMSLSLVDEGRRVSQRVMDGENWAVLRQNGSYFSHGRPLLGFARGDTLEWPSSVGYAGST